jgi:hypothetical protein
MPSGSSSSSSSNNNPTLPPNPTSVVAAAVAAGEYVVQVHPHDVLFGRGSGPNDHEGNIRFRELVAQRKGEYMATNHRQTKARIAQDIVNQVLGVGGRFLKKLEAEEVSSKGLLLLSLDDNNDDNNNNSIRNNNNNDVDVYQVVGDDTVMEKAKQALRQNRNTTSTTTNTITQPSLSPKSHNVVVTPPIVADNNGGGANATGGIIIRETPNNNNNNNLMMCTTDSSVCNGRPVFHPPIVTQTTTLEHPHHNHHFPNLAYAQQQQPEISSRVHHPQQSVQIYGTKNDTMFAQDQQQQQHNPEEETITNEVLYSFDSDGYATYTTTLDYPNDERYFPDTNQSHHHHNDIMTSSQSHFQSCLPHGPYTDMNGADHNDTVISRNNPPLRRLGGRKTDPLITGMMMRSSGHLTTQQPSQQQQVSSSSYPSQQQQQHNASTTVTVKINNNNNNNMGKRESLQFEEIWRRQSLCSNYNNDDDDDNNDIKDPVSSGQSMQMSELMESIKNMSTTIGDEVLYSSDDTIGTIDGLPAGMMMSTAEMSGISQLSIMNMSTDSMLFKNPISSNNATGGCGGIIGDRKKISYAGNNNGDNPPLEHGGGGGSRESWDGPVDNYLEETVRTTIPVTTTTTVILDGNNNNVTLPINDKPYDSVAADSIGSSGFWNSRQLQGLMQGPMEASSTNFDSSQNYHNYNSSSSNPFLRGDYHNTNI